MASELDGGNDLPSTIKPAKRFGATELNKSIFDCFDSLSSSGFCIMKVGETCNGKYSVNFSDAECDFHHIRERGQGRFLGFPFSSVFRSGFELLQSLGSGDRVFTELEDHEQTALATLNEFLKDIDLAEKSLHKVLRTQESSGDSNDLKEAETVVLAEHLLGKLCSGQSYIIDSKIKNKGKCSCDCEKTVKYGGTGIGHELVWHGSVDIMFLSHEGLPECVATVEKSKPTSCTESTESFSCDGGSHCKDADNYNLTSVQDKEEPPEKIQRCEETCPETDHKPRGRYITEDKVISTGSENQAISQALVFSMLQRQRHPGLPNYLIPNIVISPDGFRVIMYESKLDVLICSNRFPLFHTRSEYLNKASVIIMWMVLHYKLFCTGFNENALDPDVKLCQIQSDFQTRVSHRLEIYLHKLKSFVSHFPIVQKETFPTNDDIIYRKNVFKRKLSPRFTSSRYM